MKFKFIYIIVLLVAFFVMSCQTNSPENAASQYQDAEDTKAALDAEEDFVLTRNGLNNEEKYPWFTSAYKNYEPDGNAVSKLRENKNHLSFIVFGGSWCPDTKQALPKFYKVVENANISSDKIQLFGVDHDKNSLDNAGKSKEFDINRVPVFIVFYDGKEIGRLNEKPEKTLEKDIVALVQQ